jgi:hypothetical protein
MYSVCLSLEKTDCMGLLPEQEQKATDRFLFLQNEDVHILILSVKILDKLVCVDKSSFGAAYENRSYE